MNCLFVVNTPLQLLSAYVLANSIHSHDYKHLLLLHPNGYESWHKSYCLTKMAGDQSTWQQITLQKRWINRDTRIAVFKTQIDEMRDKI